MRYGGIVAVPCTPDPERDNNPYVAKIAQTFLDVLADQNSIRNLVREVEKHPGASNYLEKQGCRLTISLSFAYPTPNNFETLKAVKMKRIRPSDYGPPPKLPDNVVKLKGSRK